MIARERPLLEISILENCVRNKQHSICSSCLMSLALLRRHSIPSTTIFIPPTFALHPVTCVQTIIEKENWYCIYLTLTRKRTVTHTHTRIEINSNNKHTVQIKQRNRICIYSRKRQSVFQKPKERNRRTLRFQDRVPQQLDFFDPLSRSIPTVRNRSRSSLHCMSLEIERVLIFDSLVPTTRYLPS